MKFNISLILAFLCSLGACSKGAVFKKGESEQKPPDAGGDQALDASVRELPIALATYEMTVKADTGLSLCKGTAQFTFSSGYSINPQGKLKCLAIGERDLASMLGGAIGPFVKTDMKNFPEFGKIVRSSNSVDIKLGAQFTPPRLERIGPLIQDPTIFKDYEYREATSFSFVNKDNKRIDGKGEWLVKVFEINSTVVPEGYTGTEKFDNVIRWEIRLEGVDEDISKGDIRAFDSMMYYFNVQPIRVPRILIKTKLKDVMPGGLSKIGDVIFKGITIDLNLREWSPL